MQTIITKRSSVPTIQSPFEGDLLERPESASVLRQLVDIFSDGSVIGLNGKWGSGKTTFLTYWELYMQRLGYNVIHFNSWENDDVDDPLLALIAEFKRLSGNDNTRWKAVANNLGKITLAMLPSILAALAQHFTGLDVKDIVEKGSDEVVNIVESAIENYSSQKKTIKAFKESLSEYVSDHAGGKPLVYVIDELDRCNPAFAVKTLERIKHLFDIENVVYILAIDQIQLCNSIKGYYGSEHFDAVDYLRRFVQFTYDLPQSKPDRFIADVMKRLGFDDLMANDDTKKENYSYLEMFFSQLYKGIDMSLRQMEQYLIYTRIALANTQGLTIQTSTIALLVYIKMFDTEFFDKYSTFQIEDDAIIEHIESHFSVTFFDTGIVPSLYCFYPAVAELIFVRYQHEARSERLFNKNGDLRFKVSRFNMEQFPQCFTCANERTALLPTILNRLNFVSQISI